MQQRFRFLIAFLALLPILLPGQSRIAPVGQWTAYLSYNNIVEIAEKGNLLYVISAGGLFSVDKTSKEIRTFSTIEGLSGVDPTTIYSDSESGNVFIGYQSGVINYFQTPDQIKYITDIERSELFTTKGVNAFSSKGNLLYIATEFGIVVYDTDKNETRLSITKIQDNNTGSEVIDLEILNDTLWATMGTRGVYYVSLSEPNISAPTVWRKASGVNGLPTGTATQMARTTDLLYCLVVDTVFLRKRDGDWVRAPFPATKYRTLNATNNVVFGTYGFNVYLLYPDSTTVERFGGPVVQAAFVDGDNIDSAPLWIGDELEGLKLFNEGSLLQVSPDGPLNNFVTDLAAGNGELYIAPKGKNGSSNRHFDKSGIPYYSLNQGGWTLIDHRTGELPVDKVYQDFARGVYDPATGKGFMGSWGEGVVELYQGDTVAFYTSNNSPLSNGINSVNSDWSRVSALEVDRLGNLWIGLMLGDAIINVKSPEGQWYKYIFSGNPIGMLIDDFDQVWLNNQGQGLIVFTNNGTFDNTGDDQVKYLTNAVGSGGLPNTSVFAMAKDKDGQIWIGTNEGITVFYDPGSVFTNFFQDASCPIIDGFCLLRDQKVTDIEVDGANRKWIGTENGVYLVNPDGTELIAHYTTENSPLFDNDIKALEIDQSTGEIFIGTNKGLISLMGDATEGKDDSEDLYVFPNPVYEDYDGTITITNSVANATVRITTASGMVVRELESLGGQTIWDGLDAWGNRVKPGIYLILLADADGEGAGVTKLAVVERR